MVEKVKKKEKSPYEVKKEDLKEFLISIEKHSGSLYAFGKLWTKSGAKILNNSPCHASFTTDHQNGLIAYCSGFPGTVAQQEVIERVWKWVSDPNKSPWRILLEDIELVRSPKTNHPLGFILGEKVTIETPFNFKKNFSILLRTMVEKHNHWMYWYHLVENKKVDECDAAYLASMFSSVGTDDTGKKANDPDVLTVTYYNLCGGHWGITDRSGYPGYSYNSYPAFDWKVFRSGSIPKTVTRGHESINGFFLDQSSRLDGYKSLYTLGQEGKIPSSEVKGKFSQGNSYDTNTILDFFYKWQDEEGVLL